MEDLDMPQPLSRVKPNAEINVGAQSLTLFPQFLPHIAGTIAQWAHIDGDFATLFSRFLHTDIELGTAVYQAFHGLETRRTALFTAAKKALPEHQQIALDAVWRANKPSRDQRDRFAHHVWGYSRNIPNALLLMDSSVAVDVNISFRRSLSLGGLAGLISAKDFDRERVFVYRKKDFEKALEDALHASRLVNYLYYWIAHVPTATGNIGLLSEPRFQQAVQPLIREKSPEVQALLSPEAGAPGSKWKVYPVKLDDDPNK